MLLDIFLTFFLVLLNGFFVAAEFAIVKVRISQLQVRADSSFTARVAEGIVNNLDAYLAATQLGITLASLGLGWIGEGVVSRIIINSMHLFGLEIDDDLAHKIALPFAFATITVLHIIFGELAPKSLAIRFPTPTTLWVASPLRVFYVIFSPFIWMLNGLANFLLKLVGIQPVPHAEIHSEEELKLIIAESAEGGAIQSSERDLIQNVFEFDDRQVWHVLRPRTQLVAIDVDSTLQEAMEIAISEGYSRYPVYKDSVDNITGIVITKDVMMHYMRDPEKTLQDLVRPVIFVNSNRKIMHLLRTFQKEHTQMAIVVNEFGGTVGLVTLEDIIEELVGEIQDEYDTEQPVVEKISEGVFKVLAQNPMEEINESLPERLPTSAEYLTLSGLLLKVTDAIPKVGEVISINNYEIKVLKMFHASPEIVEIRWKGLP
ncbi:MAG: HlyC/CorC family transporter [Saprospiraceae bacterium]|jgi:CBS domain containing-hemolysin-like protein|nr:HlyC/CorC family transporter [Saprospiraceae bacterium]